MDLLRKQVNTLAEENGKLLGHQNLNQKIQYLVKLKKDYAKLTEVSSREYSTDGVMMWCRGQQSSKLSKTFLLFCFRVIDTSELIQLCRSWRVCLFTVPRTRITFLLPQVFKTLGQIVIIYLQIWKILNIFFSVLQETEKLRVENAFLKETKRFHM